MKMMEIHLSNGSILSCEYYQNGKTDFEFHYYDIGGYEERSYGTEDLNCTMKSNDS